MQTKNTSTLHDFLNFFWNEDQIYNFYLIIQAWHFMQGYCLSNISDSVDIMHNAMPVIIQYQQEGLNVPTQEEFEQGRIRFIEMLKDRNIFPEKLPYLFEQRYITPSGLRYVVSYIDQGKSNILNDWNDNYFNELELNTF